MIHFFRLIRGFNLLIIVATMYSLGWYFDELFSSSGLDSIVWSSSFFMLVFSTVLIAAAGNIINDYFDVKADRINRPESVVIGKYIKRRWGIVLHWGINFIAFSMAAYLSYLFQTFWYLFIHLLSINLLWYYSMQLKRTLIIGNITIALLTGLVPLLVGIYFNQYLEHQTLDSYYPFQLHEVNNYPIYIALALGLFAFLLSWSREIVKDIEDIQGDKVLKAKTLPIQLGIKSAKRIALFLLLIPVLLSGLLVLAYRNDYIISMYAFSPLFVAAVVLSITLFLGIKAQLSKEFKMIHLFIKLIMVLGLLLPVFWVIINKF